MRWRSGLWGSGAVVWVGAVVTAIVSSCTSLPEIQRGTCGNGVVEPEHNEDCDESVVDDGGHLACYPAGTASQCHFDCTNVTCPPSFACGTDNVCRKPRGIFKPAGQATQVDADRLFAGDFNHDGLGDVVAQTAVQMNVLYGDTTAALTLPFTIRQPNANPAVGLLAFDDVSATSEPNSDLVFSATNAVTTWRGRSDRTLAPTPYPSILVGNGEPRVFELHVFSPTDNVLMFLPVSNFVAGASGSFITQVTASGSLDVGNAFAVFPQTPSALVGDIVIGNFDESPASPCSEFTFAFGSDTTVNVYTTCADATNLNTFDRNKALGPPKPATKVALSGGAVVRANGLGIHTGDVNGDGHLDFIVDAATAIGSADGGLNPITLVAYGIGDGNFSSSDTLAPVDNTARLLVGVSSPVLAIGQLTKPDLAYDYVTADGIVRRFGSNDAGVSDDPPAIASTQPFVSAKILDVDGDGNADVIAGSPARVDLFRGTGGAIVTDSLFAVDGTPDQFSFGDFDGDHALDIAFRSTHPDQTADLDVMWGKTLGVPDDPDVIGRFDGIVQVSAALIGGDLGNNDAVGDIGVLVKTPISDPNQVAPDGGVASSFAISVLPGSTSRQLQAPFFIQQTVNDGPGNTPQRHSGLPLAFGIGQLTAGDRHEDLVCAAGVVVDPNQPHGLRDMRLAIAPTTGAALLDTGTVLFSNAFDEFNAISAQTQLPSTTTRKLPQADWSRLSLTTVDLDGPSAKGIDEIVGLAPSAGKTGQLFSAKFDGTNWVVGPLTSIGSAALGNAVAIAQVASADLNGDGNDDVLVLSDGGKFTKLEAHINDKSGQLPPKSTVISLPDYASINTETPFQIVSIAAIDADTDPGKEVAMLTDKGGLFLAKSNAAGDHFTVTGPLCNGDELETCKNTPHNRIPSGQAIAAIDVDGDGVQDLVIESNLTLQVYKGLAVDP